MLENVILSIGTGDFGPGGAIAATRLAVEDNMLGRLDCDRLGGPAPSWRDRCWR